MVPEGPRGQGFKGSSEMLKNYKELNPCKKPYELCLKIRRSGVPISSNIAEGYGTKTTFDQIRMLYISYGSVCKLDTQILLAEDLGFIEKGELSTAKKDIAEIERMLKALIKYLENKHLNP